MSTEIEDLLLTIITPVYNRGIQLRDNIKSVIKNIDIAFEYILVDDYSTDQSREILQQYEKQDTRIKCIYNEKNIGVSASRNKALDRAVGRYVLMLDHDDYLTEDFFAEVKVLSEDNPDIIMTNYRLVTTSLKVIGESKRINSRCGAERFGLYSLTSTGVVYKRKLIEQYHIRYPEGKLCEDSVWGLYTNSLFESIAVSDKIGCLYTQSEHSLSKNSDVYAFMTKDNLPLEEYKKMIRIVDRNISSQREIFEYYCCSYALLACFWWTRYSCVRDVKYVVVYIDSILREQLKIGKNPYLHYAAYKTLGVDTYLSLCQHMGIVIFNVLLKTRTLIIGAITFNRMCNLWKCISRS